MEKPQDIVWISRGEILDLEYVGKKAFELGELRHLNIPIPDGFVIKTTFFKKFLETTGILKDIEETKKIYHPSLVDSVEKLFQPVKEKIMHAHISADLILEIHKSYRKLAGELRQVPVDIFSSSKTDKSILFPKVVGDANVIVKIKTILSEYLDDQVAVIIAKSMNANIKGKMSTNNLSVDKRLTGGQNNQLFKYCREIQRHFYFPKEVDYVIEKNKIYIKKLTPLTETADSLPEKKMHVKKFHKLLLKGNPVCFGIATGPAKILNKPHTDTLIKKDDVLILSRFDAKLYNKMKKARAVIVDSVLPTPADKAKYRDNVQIPTVEGTKSATNTIRDGNIVTVNGSSGEIYSGGLIS